MLRARSTTAAESGLPARHLQSYVKVLERLSGDVDLPVAADDILREVARAVACESAALSVDDRKGACPVIARIGQEAWQPEDLGKSSQPLAGKSVEQIEDEFRNNLGERGYASVAVAPLRSGERVVGVLRVAAREAGRCSPEDVAFLERVGSRLGEAVDAWWRREDGRALAAVFDDRHRGIECLLAIGRMVSAVAHDIKNPLAGMMLAAQRLRKALDSRPDEQKLAHIADRLCAAIDSLSETASSVSHMVREPAFDLQPVDLHEVLSSVVVLVARRANAHGTRIGRAFAAPSARIRAEANFLRRAFLDLMGNALDAMPSGGELSVRTRAYEGERIEAVITDTGEGLGTEAIETLFRPFVSTRPGRAGLGLTIARRIVELHGGVLCLRPAPGGGTEAVVDFPLVAHESPE